VPVQNSLDATFTVDETEATITETLPEAQLLNALENKGFLSPASLHPEPAGLCRTSVGEQSSHLRFQTALSRSLRLYPRLLSFQHYRERGF